MKNKVEGQLGEIKNELERLALVGMLTASSMITKESVLRGDRELVKKALATQLISVAEIADSFGVTVQEIDVMAKEYAEKMKEGVSLQSMMDWPEDK